MCLLQILFLNKVDRFQEKIMGTDRHLRLFFSQYTGVHACVCWVEWAGFDAAMDVSIVDGSYLVWVLLTG